MEALFVRHMMACARTQDMIDVAVAHHLKSRLPQLGPVMAERWLSRVNDADRLSLFHGLVAEAGSDVDVTNFDAIYTEAIDLRNRLAHGGAMRSSIEGQEIVDRTPRQRGKDIPFLHLSDHDFLTQVLRAEWAAQVVMYVCVETGAATAAVWDGSEEIPMDLVLPPAEPPSAVVS